jgi:hypothetical protein
MLEEPNRLPHIDADKYDLHYSAAILATLPAVLALLQKALQ